MYNSLKKKIIYILWVEINIYIYEMYNVSGKWLNIFFKKLVFIWNFLVDMWIDLLFWLLLRILLIGCKYLIFMIVINSFDKYNFNC